MAAIMRPNRWKRQPSGIVTLDPGHAWGRTAEFVYVGGVDHELVSKNLIVPASVQAAVNKPTTVTAITKNGSPALAYFSDSVFNLAEDSYMRAGVVGNAVNMHAKGSTWAVHAVRLHADVTRQAFAERDLDNFGWNFGVVDAGSGGDGLGLFVASTTNDSVATCAATTVQGEPYSFIATYPGNGAAHTETKFFFNGRSMPVTSGYGNTAGIIDDKLGELFIGRAHYWWNRNHGGYIFIVAGFDGLWGEGEAQAWDENPWQFLQRPASSSFLPYVPRNSNVIIEVESGLAQSYAVRNAVAFSTSLNQYGVRGTAERSRLADYRILAGVARSTSTQDYQLFGQAALSQAFNYTVEGSVESELDSEYAVRVEVAQSVAAQSYVLRGQVTKTFELEYEILDPLANEFPFEFGIGGVYEVATSLPQFYEIKGLAERDLFSGYILKAEVVARMSIPYDVRNAIEQVSPTFTYAVGSVIVSNVLSCNHAVKQLTDQALTPAYAIRGIVQQSLAGTYVVIGPLEKELDLAYEIKNAVESPMIKEPTALLFGGEPILYGGEPIQYGQDTSGLAIYDVRNITLINPMTLNYSIKQVVERVLGSWFDVENGLSQALSCEYAVKTAVTSPALAEAFAIRDIVERAFTVTHAVRGQINQGVSFSYILRNAVEQPASFSFNVIGPVGQSLANNFDVRNEVTRFLPTSYTIRHDATQTVFVQYAIKGYVAQAVGGDYAVRSIVAQPYASTYALRSLVVREQIFNYRLNADIVENDLDCSYALKGSVESDLDCEYIVRNEVNQEYDSSYLLIGTVSAVLPCNYVLDNDNNSFLNCSYFLQGQVSSVLTCTMNVRLAVSKTRTFVHSIIPGKELTTEFIYTIGGDDIITLSRNEAFDVPQVTIAENPNSDSSYNDV